MGGISKREPGVTQRESCANFPSRARAICSSLHDGHGQRRALPDPRNAEQSRGIPTQKEQAHLPACVRFRAPDERGVEQEKQRAARQRGGDPRIAGASSDEPRLDRKDSGEKHFAGIMPSVPAVVRRPAARSGSRSMISPKRCECMAKSAPKMKVNHGS